MVVSADAVAGTIGGGHLEWQAIAHARHLLVAPLPPTVPQVVHLALGPSLGQCCGGALDLRYDLLGPDLLGTWPEPAPWFHLQLFGAGHVGRAVVNALAALPCRIDWVDERDGEFPSPLVGLGAPQTRAEVRKLCVDAVEAEVAHAPPGALYLIMTHQHDLDLRITEAVLRRGDARFVGLIGSKTKRARFEHRLVARGLSADALTHLTCPIGMLPSAGAIGKDPAVIAAGVAAQLLQVVQGA